MAAASSSGTNQQLALDRPSFEKLLAAAWVLQCLHDQLHPPVETAKVMAQHPALPEKMETAALGLTGPFGSQKIRPEIFKPEVVKPEIIKPEIIKPEVAQPKIQISVVAMAAVREPVVASADSSADKTLTELVKTHEAIETGISKLDATVKRLVSSSPKLALELALQESALVKPIQLEAKPTPPAQPGVSAALIKASPIRRKPSDENKPVPTPAFNLGIRLNRLRRDVIRHVSTLQARAAGRLRAVNSSARARLRIDFNRLHAAVTGYRADLRLRTARRLASHGISLSLAALNRLRDACSVRTTTFRINFNLRSLRAVAIATPVWLLVVIANLLLLETWLHQPFQDARAMSTPSSSTAQAAVNLNQPIPTRSSRPPSLPAKKIESTGPRQPTSIPPFAASHDQITDPATSSVVEQLSRFEIGGLRRQAKYGDDSAAFTLGMAYEVGHYVRQNCAEAARWVTMAAEEGNPAAQYNLGLRYRDGDGVSADLHESEKWLRKAAAQRVHNAKLALQLLASR